MSGGLTDGDLRVAVVGVGKMGQNHARCLSSMKGVDLVAVVDVDPVMRQSVAESSGSLAVESIHGLDGVDAAVVAVSTAHHAEVGCALMERGIHCLVEKPLAGNLDDAQLLPTTRAWCSRSATWSDSTRQFGNSARRWRARGFWRSMRGG